MDETDKYAKPIKELEELNKRIADSIADLKKDLTKKGTKKKEEISSI